MTHEQQNACTEEHQILHSRLIERIFDRVRVFVITMIAFPGSTEGGIVIGTAITHELELKTKISWDAKGKICVTHIAISLVKQGRCENSDKSHN